MKRACDVILAAFMMVPLLIPMTIIALVIRLTSRGPAFHRSDRAGADNKIFKMLKFRTMRIGTPSVATHLLADPAKHITPIGGFLRRTSLDELPQLFNILRGDMSFVGPRPALYNQYDLIALRTAKGVHRIKPGLTGWAQINGRDELPIPLKVEFDAYYCEHRSMALDARILGETFIKAIRGDGVSH